MAATALPTEPQALPSFFFFPYTFLPFLTYRTKSVLESLRNTTISISVCSSMRYCVHLSQSLSDFCQFSCQSLCLFPISLSPYFLSFYVCLSVLVARKTIYLISISTKRFLKQCIRNVKTLLQIFALISSLQLIFYLIISIRIAISLMLICHPKYSKFWPV